MKKKKGRIISLLLAATMLTSVVPATAFAGENLRGGYSNPESYEWFRIYTAAYKSEGCYRQKGGNFISSKQGTYI